MLVDFVKFSQIPAEKIVYRVNVSEPIPGTLNMKSLKLLKHLRPVFFQCNLKMSDYLLLYGLIPHVLVIRNYRFISSLSCTVHILTSRDVYQRYTTLNKYVRINIYNLHRFKRYTIICVAR